MNTRRSTPLAALALALALPLAALAQDTAQPGDAVDGTAKPEAPTGTEFSTGEPAEAADGEIPEGGLYVVEVIGDWEIRCVKTADGFDPCQMYQLLNDAKDNPTAEVTVVNLTESGEAVAGATVLTPLETLLTQMVTITVDGGTAKRYPFTWCDQFGCYSRIGFTAPEVDQLRRGAGARVSIVPAQAPTQKVEMTLSLTGFTKAFEAMLARNTETARLAQEARGDAPAEGGN